MAEAGCIGGGDMTPACAFSKLAYLFSKYSDAEEIRKAMLQNMVGELTTPDVPVDSSSAEQEESTQSTVSSTSAFTNARSINAQPLFDEPLIKVVDMH